LAYEVRHKLGENKMKLIGILKATHRRLKLLVAILRANGQFVSMTSVATFAIEQEITRLVKLNNIESEELQQ
jgi:hypothetical protein